MARIHGRNGLVKVSGATVGYVTNFTYEETADTAEKTAMLDTKKSFLPGIVQGSGSVDFRYEEDNAGQVAVTDALRAGAEVVLVLDPDNNTTGKALSGSTIIVGYSYTQSMDDVINASFSYNGVLDWTAE